MTSKLPFCENLNNQQLVYNSYSKENADVVRIGTSNYNRKWLITAYGRDSVEPYFDKPVICSGSTMGHQIAIETYLRAMVS